MPNVQEADLVDPRLSEVLAAYLEAEDAGWAPDPERLVARYPNLADQLETFFAIQDQVAHLADSLPPPLPSGGGRGGPVSTQLSDGLTAPGPTTQFGESLSERTQIFGDYEIDKEIAHGGMGIVFKARQKSLNRIVALKQIRTGQFASRAEVKRFLNEAENAASLDHPNIVPIYNVGEHNGRHFFTMKLIEGGSLATRLDEFRLPLLDPRTSKDEKGHSWSSSEIKNRTRKLVQMMTTVAQAVHHAHQQGILHRDLKPANILLDAKGQPLVTDFGLSKRLESDAEWSQFELDGGSEHLALEPMPDMGQPATRVPGGDVTSLATTTGAVGTLSYMSPEQAAGPKGRLSTATDVYSLGIILYRLLTGSTPFTGRSRLETLRLIREETPISPRELNPLANRDLEAICLKCLEKEPTNRYVSAHALAEDLDRWRKGAPVLARRRSLPVRLWQSARQSVLVGTLLAMVGFGAGIALILYLRDPERPIKEIQGMLKKGKFVTLIGETGRPNWMRPWGGDLLLAEARGPDQEFQLCGSKDLHLELLPNPLPMRSYRLSAEVRQDGAFSNEKGQFTQSEVGIYFGHRPHYDGACLCQLAFADIGTLANSLPAPDSSYVGLSLRRFEDGSNLNGDHVRAPDDECAVAFPPEAGKWRRLEVIVTPDFLEAHFDGQPVFKKGKRSADQLRQDGMGLWPTRPAPADAFEFASDGAVGLYVLRGTASFRQVVVTPLP